MPLTILRISNIPKPTLTRFADALKRPSFPLSAALCDSPFRTFARASMLTYRHQKPVHHPPARTLHLRALRAPPFSHRVFNAPRRFPRYSPHFNPIAQSSTSPFSFAIPFYDRVSSSVSVHKCGQIITKFRDLRVSEGDGSSPSPSGEVINEAQPERVDSGAYSSKRGVQAFLKVCFLWIVYWFFSWVIFSGSRAFEYDSSRVECR